MQELAVAGALGPEPLDLGLQGLNRLGVSQVDALAAPALRKPQGAGHPAASRAHLRDDAQEPGLRLRLGDPFAASR